MRQCQRSMTWQSAYNAIRWHLVLSVAQKGAHLYVIKLLVVEQESAASKIKLVKKFLQTGKQCVIRLVITLEGTDSSQSCQ